MKGVRGLGTSSRMLLLLLLMLLAPNVGVQLLLEQHRQEGGGQLIVGSYTPGCSHHGGSHGATHALG